MRKVMMGLGLLVAGIGGLAAGPAEASCFYNKSQIDKVRVQLDCGWFCSNDWNISKDAHECRGGEGGTVKVGLPGETERLMTTLEDNWYAVIEGSCGGMTVKVFTDYHALINSASTAGIMVGNGCR